MNPIIQQILDLLWCIVLLVYYSVLATYKFFVPSKKDVTGEIVLITGAGSGLGQGLCVEFAKLGCTIVGWDISTEGLDRTGEMIKSKAPGAKYYSYICDVTKREMIYQIADKVKEDVGDVNILFNNAGIVTGKKFLDCPDNMLQKTMDINTTSHFWTLKAFLPEMIEANHGHVVTIASAAGFFGVPGLIDYVASKFGAVGLSEALYMELTHLKKTGIKVTCVCPTYINTGMFDGVKTTSTVQMLSKDYAVSNIVNAVLSDQYLLMMPKLVYFMAALKTFVPTQFLVAFSGISGSSSAMDTFQGRKKMQ